MTEIQHEAADSGGAGSHGTVASTPASTQLARLAGLTAVLLFAVAGWQMLQLESVSGDSLAEFFYRSVGILSFGLSASSVHAVARDW